MRNIFRFFLSLVTAIVLFGCSDRLDDYYTAEDLAGLKVHIQLPDYSRALVKTRASDTDGEQINSVTVIAYNSDGGFISQQTVTPVNGVIKPSLPSGTSSITVVANYDHTFTEEETKTLASTLVSPTLDASKPICWGTASINDLLTSNSPEISLLRMTAKVTVTNNVSDFTLQGIKMCNTADKGTIAPADGKGDAITTLVNDTRSYPNPSGDATSTSPQVFYETPAGKAYLIVKGTYNNTTGYYKVKFYKDQKTDNTELDLLRNHNYNVIINSVNDVGYATIEKAEANDAENRMSVTVIDDNPPIVNMISCKDYELGVCDTRTFNGTGAAIDENGNTKDKDDNAVTQNITVATSYKSNNAYTYNISTTDSWITVDNSKAEMTTFASNGSNGSAGSESNRGAKFVIPVTVSANPTENKRDGTVTVTAGDLTRTITITQAGFDFLADDKRKVLFFIDNTQKSDDYFGTFLPAVNGVKAADNQGLGRDHGLHFAAVNGNTYSYKVPHLTDDKLTNNDASHISITDGGEGYYYTVTLKDNTDDDLWKSSFTITNQAGVTITYPVYHTGVFHHITSTDNQLGTTKKSGWFYYGVVEVNGKSGTYHILDRNIGASNNGFYSPATQATKKNEGAVGAYLKLFNSTSDNKKIDTQAEWEALGSSFIPFPSYFTLPDGGKDDYLSTSYDELSDLPISVNKEKTASGEEYYCYSITTTGASDVQPAKVYLPVTGYYEGEKLQNENHANIWSRTRLSGYQGFSGLSDEYGFWFLYLDISGSISTISNIRFVNGSAGRVGIGGDISNSIYNALPVRGIHKK